MKVNKIIKIIYIQNKRKDENLSEFQKKQLALKISKKSFQILFLNFLNRIKFHLKLPMSFVIINSISFYQVKFMPIDHQNAKFFLTYYIQ